MNPYEPPDEQSQLDRIDRRFELHQGDRSSYVFEDEKISDNEGEKHAAKVLAYINANPFYEDC
jgi:hypothetical protein